MKVQLIQPHTHAEVDYTAGDVIDVTPPEAEWLTAQGIVQPSNTPSRWLTAAPLDEHDEDTTP